MEYFAELWLAYIQRLDGSAFCVRAQGEDEFENVDHSKKWDASFGVTILLVVSFFRSTSDPKKTIRVNKR